MKINRIDKLSIIFKVEVFIIYQRAYDIFFLDGYFLRNENY